MQARQVIVLAFFLFGATSIFTCFKTFERKSCPEQAELRAEGSVNGITIHLSEVQSYRGHLRLKHVGNARKQWAVSKYQLDDQPGKGHYPLLGYLSSKHKRSIIVDIGTRWGDSARALASESQNFVFTFDLMNAADRIAKANAISVDTLEEQLGNVHFFQNTNILKSRRGKAILRAASIVMLDTLHAPDVNRFEYDFFDLLQTIGFKGLLICDDIHLNVQMAKWWKSIPLEKHDLTIVGHSSGTGLVDFSRRGLTIRE
mmetsp:Transcript_14137/g.34218  ORF Transcript_14137/g.34218 Transcript_14137/m.34218 type:complete len:258 (-) Transcript_14137:703-1476(-)|eukprot:CAMPEP_0181348614 /NCGR_PEP_ID=MMETSP1106-20121128/274_1 /TAXON_ID=81844 /ORGANISM="Mantoniella antarctica, Strain SL-175" /LENGTH=257 /DNA_ID=CAMNT_0023460927 /DNA_START=139 /DNA_END=912 /DNA_ORIENTATION=+